MLGCALAEAIAEPCPHCGSSCWVNLSLEAGGKPLVLDAEYPQCLPPKTAPSCPVCGCPYDGFDLNSHREEFQRIVARFRAIEERVSQLDKEAKAHRVRALQAAQQGAKSKQPSAKGWKAVSP